MKVSTKDRILDSSRIHFNTHGYGASSLYQIAQQMKISRGNLTYHFKDKGSLLDIHLDKMVKRSKDSFTSSFLVPSWQTLIITSEDFLQVQKDYSYIFFDKNILFLPKVQKRIKAIRENHIRIQMSMINVSIQSGNMKDESVPGMYHNLSRTLWQILFFYLIAKNFKAKEDVTWDRQMWCLLLPHFTDKGTQSFINHFGKDYYLSLGEDYNSFMQEILTF